MKFKLLALFAATAFFMASCGGGSETKKEGAKEESHEGHDHSSDDSKKNMEKATYSVDTEASTVKWEGGTSGVQVYSHSGTIDISKGEVMTKGNEITGGMVTIDMTTINPTDSNYGEENPPSKLVGHLTTGDFFLVDSFKTATFEVTSATADAITGNLTIRGNTHEETINVEKIEMKDGSMKVNGKLTFDRQKYDVNWKHYLKDVLLKDDIELDFTLVANKSNA